MNQRITKQIKRKKPRLTAKDFAMFNRGGIQIMRYNSKARKGEVLYYLKYRSFDLLPVLYSANAWWAHPRKLIDLINGFRTGLNVQESCIYAGVTVGQWEYFNKVHPEFSGLYVQFMEDPIWRMRLVMLNAAMRNPRFAMKYLVFIRPWQFGPKAVPVNDDKIEPEIEHTDDNQSQDLINLI